MKIYLKVFRTLRKNSLMLLSLGVFLLSGTLTFAGNVTPAEAVAIAERYVQVNKQVRRMAQTRTAKLSPYYIYNDDRGKGFVVVAGHDGMGELLAYSDDGKLDTTNADSGVRDLLRAYRQVYRQLNLHPSLTTRAVALKATGDEVRPLLKTYWGQHAPFNNRLNFGYDVPTGCVATAMSQIMYYHRWPEHGRGQNSYKQQQGDSIMTLSADFSKSTYAWQSMLPVYQQGSYSAEQADAVARLLRDLGIATNMQYSKDGSGATDNDAENAFGTYFDYDVAAISLDIESPVGFLDIMRSELRKGFPIFMAGSSDLGGHAWVADGFNHDGLVHMNFGWYGNGNGYYAVSVLNLVAKKKEDYKQLLDFRYNPVIILAHPNKAGVPKIEEALREQTSKLSFDVGGDMHFLGAKPTAPTADAKVVYTHFYNRGDKPFKGDVGLGIYDEKGNMMRTCPSDYYAKGGYTVARFQGGELAHNILAADTLAFKADLSNLKNGTYTLAPVYAERKADGKWGQWTRMKMAPRIVLEVQNGKVLYDELPSNEPALQLVEKPILEDSLQIGVRNMVHLAVRKLDGRDAKCAIRAEVVDEKGQLVSTGVSRSLIIYPYGTTVFDVPLTLPRQVKGQKCRIRIKADVTHYIVDKEVGTRIDVKDYKMREPWYVTIAKTGNEKFFGSTIISVEDADGVGHGNEIDYEALQKARLHASFEVVGAAGYVGPVRYQLTDMVTGRVVSLGADPSSLNLTEGQSGVGVYSIWMAKNNVQLVNGRWYKVGLIVNLDGKDVDVFPKWENPYCIRVLNGPYNSDEDITPTGINTTETKGNITFEGGVLNIQQTGLQTVSVYSLNGALVQRVDAAGKNNLTISLPHGTYIVKITTNTAAGNLVRKVSW